MVKFAAAKNKTNGKSEKIAKKTKLSRKNVKMKGSKAKNQKVKQTKKLKQPKTQNGKKNAKPKNPNKKKTDGKLRPGNGVAVKANKPSPNPAKPGHPTNAPKKQSGFKRFLQGKNRKWAIVGATIAIILALLVILLIIYLLMFAKLPPILCDSDLCLQASKLLNKSAKFDVDPCIDFYEHVCGNFSGFQSIRAENQLALYFSLIGQMQNNNIKSPTFNKIRKFHGTCVKDGGYTLRDIAMEFVHGTPKTSLQDAIIYLLKLTPNIGIFQLAPFPYTDPKTNKKFYKLVVTPSYEYLDYASFNEFKQHVNQTIYEIYNEVIDELPPKFLEKYVRQIVAVAKDFIDSYLTSNFASNELEKPVNGIKINWKEIVTAISSKKHPLYNRVFALKGYTQILNKLADKHTKESLIDFMKFVWFRTTMMYDFTRKPELIEVFCGINTMLMFSSTLGYFHAQSNGTMKNDKELVGIAGNVKGSFVDLIKKSSWIDGETKDSAADKVKKIAMRHVNLGKDQVEELYETLTIDTNAYFFKMMQDAQKWKMAKSYQMIAELNNEELGVFSISDDGQYKETGNLIYFMNGVTDSSLFHIELPVFFNYGRAGHSIGQQMGKSLGPKYYNWDAYANRKQLWKRETELKMRDNLACVVDHFGKTWKVDAKLNLEEHAADIISSRAALLAMQEAANALRRDVYLPGFENKTNEQMFFYSQAAVHCESEAYRKSLGDSAKHLSGRIRVNGPFSLSSDFAKAFGCKEGSKMNPAKKCEYF